MLPRLDFFLNDFLQGGREDCAGVVSKPLEKIPLAQSSSARTRLANGFQRCIILFVKKLWEEAMLRRVTLAAASTACLAAIAVAAPAAAQEAAAPAIVAPEKLKWMPTPFPNVTVAVISGNLTGSGMYAMMAKYAPGAKSVPHTHPDQRVVTVISGTYYSASGTEFDESKLKPIAAGTTIIVPANAPHYALAKDGETILLEVGTAPSGTNIWPKAAAK